MNNCVITKISTKTNVRLWPYLTWGLLLIAYLALSGTYRVMFVVGAEDGISSSGRYSGGIVDDALVYQSFQDNPRGVLEENLKNYIGPVMLAYLMRGIPAGDFWINAVFVALSGLVLLKLLKLMNINRSWPLLFLFLNPETIFYSQGFLKEVPMQLAFLLFVYGFLKKNYLVVVLGVGLAVLFRYHIAVLMGVILVFYWLPYRNKVREAFWLSFILFLFMPLFYDLVAEGFLSASAEYYTQGSVFGLGQWLTRGMQNLPLFGYIALPLHGLQNLLEPFPAVTLFVRGPGIINVGFLMMAGSLFVMVSFYIVFIVQSWRLVTGAYRKDFSQPMVKLLLILMLTVLFMGVSPFVHHRYLFLILPLLPLLAFLGRPIRFGLYAWCFVILYAARIVYEIYQVS